MHKKIVYVVCEGSSEESYLQELNRFFRAENIPLVMTPFPAGSGHFKNIVRQYHTTFKEARKRERKVPDIIIWVDRDTYIRNDLHDSDKYSQKPDHIPDFKFNYMNFEDFLSMHNDQNLAKWTNICENHNHFRIPMHASVYDSLFRNEIFPDYEKGDLPSEFTIDSNSIKTLIANNRHADNADSIIHSDFASFLEETFEQLGFPIVRKSD